MAAEPYDEEKAMARKAAIELDQVRRYLEPGPVVLVSSQHGGERDIMVMGWHTVMEFSPSLIGCVIAAGNHSFGLIRASGECVINLPTTAQLEAVLGVGSTSGADIDKFDAFQLTPEDGEQVGAPAIAECHAQFECRLHDDSLVDRYNFFIWEVVAARAQPSPVHPETLHYKGDGTFMVSGPIIHRHRAGLK
jgi:flavin reductase (DIM6/NTAB) family NADH-FMN oxidoreductase RutF